jgi:AraC-like DNA-binding protein
VQINTSDPIEALALSGALFYPHTYTSIGTSTSFSFSLLALPFDEMTVGLVTYGGEVALRHGELGSYHLRVPTDGRMRSKTKRTEVLASSSTAAVYRPDDTTELACLDPSTHSWGLKFDAAILEAHLSTLLGEPISGVIEFVPSIDLTTEMGRSWVALTEPLRDPVALAMLSQIPLVSKPYLESVTSALLLCVGHSFSERLRAPPPIVPHTNVTAAMEQIRAAPDQPWTVASLAAGSFCSVRSLQAGFRRDLDTTPMRYLAAARIAKTRHEFLLGDPQFNSVSTVATKWGFTHLGRFSLAYRKTYGESPSQTRHRSG